jgi:hypothetical protein
MSVFFLPMQMTPHSTPGILPFNLGRHCEHQAEPKHRSKLRTNLRPKLLRPQRYYFDGRTFTTLMYWFP